MKIEESENYLEKEIVIDRDGHFEIQHGTDSVVVDKEQALELAKALAFYAISGRLPE